jgi:GTP cyclohydrolase I
MSTEDITKLLPRRTASGRIRQRLIAASRRFHANDNIADFIRDGELQELQDEVCEQLRGVLDALVIDVDRDHNCRDTAERVARMFITEVFAGRYSEMPQVTAFPNVVQLDELLVIGPLAVRSACSHHLCPVIGKIWVGVKPKGESALIGLSKYARLTQWIMQRPQIQEEAMVQLADLLMSEMEPDGVALVMQADHLCMQWRGVKDAGARMTNSLMRGCFLHDAALRMEFLALARTWQ